MGFWTAAVISAIAGFRLVIGPVTTGERSERVLSEVVGEQDFARIAQSRKVAPRTGEGLAEALDVGDI